ncbi:MAG: response regulator [Actinomycetota bacterium]
MSVTRSVVVVENESLLRDLIARNLETAGFEVTTAANVSDAKRACAAFDPDACVVDIELGPGPNGFDFADFLTRKHPQVGVVFLTNLPDPRFVNRDDKTVTEKQAYLRKSQLVDSGELVRALDTVLRDGNLQRFRHDKDSDRPLAKLSLRQISVLKMLADGLSNNQIAEIRGTSVRAAEGMISRIFLALGIDVSLSGNARVEAAKKYLAAVGAIVLDE